MVNPRPTFALIFASFLVSTLASAQVDPKTASLCEGKESLAKLGGGLLEARLAAKENKANSGAAIRDYLPNALRGGRLQCIIGATVLSDGLVEACRANGLDVVGTYELPGVNHVVVQCSDLAQLEGIAERTDVLGISPESGLIRNVGAVQNQADISINASTVRSSLGFDGSGVRVGVLSDSINDVVGGVIGGGLLTGSAPQLSGDLPPSVRVIDAGPGGGADEGTGMLELIYDLAPGCQLSFASASTGYSAFASNIAALVNDPGFQCDVVVDDVFYFVEPVYQDGPIAIAADNAFAAGTAYFTSAGNHADRAYEGTYVDANAGTDNMLFPPSGDDFHDFGVSVGASSDRHFALTVAPSGTVNVLLKWDEPGSGLFAAGQGAESDLDLYLTVDTNLPLADADPTPGNANPPFDNVVARSASIQGTLGSPAGEPFEGVAYTNPSNVLVQTVFVVIDHFRGREPVEMHLQIISNDLVGIESAYSGRRTITGHSNAENAMTVAAMFYGEIDFGGALDPPIGQLDVEPFSALGGDLPIYISDNGLTRFGVPEVRFKPEITAPDGTNTSSFGVDIGFDADTHPNFFGTSAAAPHAAAVAALMLNAKPGLTPAQVYSLMRSTAIDAETPGPDFLSGDGLIDALLAVLATNPVLPASNSNWELYR